MKIPFYILGLLLRYGPQSGYDLKQIIERNIADFAKIKLPTIYYHLDKLNDKGFVTYMTDKDGNRPEKQIYSISETGKSYFHELYNKMLMDNNEFEFSIDGILYFKDSISNEDLIQALLTKKQNLISKLEMLQNHKRKTLDSMKDKKVLFCADAIFEHHIVHYTAELQWIEYLITGIRIKL